VQKIGDALKIHRLALEDVFNLHQRGKFEQYSDVFFFVTHFVNYVDTQESVQLSMFIGSNFVVTLSGQKATCLQNVAERIAKNNGQIRSMGTDYLMYALLDSVVDSYFTPLEVIGEQLDVLEEEILQNPTKESISKIHQTKRDLLGLRRSMWPIREAINSLLRDYASILSNETRLHIRDCYDHSIEIIELVETYRELASDLMDVYLSSVSNRMNEVMKVLTIIATIFVPPGLIAAIYGMNFRPDVSPWNLPELSWYYGYPYALGLMCFTSVCVLFFFWWKGWLEVLVLTPRSKNKN
jgi:magnesium transporter